MIEGIPLAQMQLHFFLDVLGIKCEFGGDEWKCGGPEFPYAKEFLTLMRIPKQIKKRFWKSAKNTGDIAIARF